MYRYAPVPSQVSILIISALWFKDIMMAHKMMVTASFAAPSLPFPASTRRILTSKIHPLAFNRFIGDGSTSESARTRLHSSITGSSTSSSRSSETGQKVEDRKNEATARSRPLSAGDHIILWRGEGVKGYSLNFRHLEFTNAYAASFQHIHGASASRSSLSDTSITYTDAIPPVDELDDLYGAMEYIHLESDDVHDNDGTSNSISTHTNSKLCKASIIDATRRCSLVRDVYEIITTGNSYQELANNTLAILQEENDDSYNNRTLTYLASDEGIDTSWSMRLRHYDRLNADDTNATRFGANKKSSMRRERKALCDMKELFGTFRGPVRLKNPDCALYVLEGLQGLAMTFTSSENSRDGDVDGEYHRSENQMVFVQKITPNPKIQPSIIAPNSRICVTRTPLCPIASILLCNLGRIQPGHRILDPYAGSASTLLAAAMIIPGIKSVGIDLAGDDRVNRIHIMDDFGSRGLNPPVKLIQGDCTDENIRDEAIRAVDFLPFDTIVTDPPYGIRESMGGDTTHNESEENNEEGVPSPLIQLVRSIEMDRERGNPLLKEGGRLAAFVPISSDSIDPEISDDGEREATLRSKLQEDLPSDTQLHDAGLKFVSMTKQPLSLTLSRWLVLYECISNVRNA